MEKKKFFFSISLTTVFAMFIFLNYLAIEWENERALWSKPNSRFYIRVSINDKKDNETETSLRQRISRESRNLSKFLNIYSSNKVEDFVNAKIICKGKYIPMSAYDYDIKDSTFIYPYDEENLMRYLEKLRPMQDFHFIDLGCGLGVHTLNMACRGHDVIAVDANVENIKRVSQSVRQNNFSDLVITINNAMADSHEEFILKTSGHRDTARLSKPDGSTNVTVTGLYIDELMPLIKHKKVIMKIDIEASEVLALRRANLLFQNFEVLAVFIEWIHIKSDPAVIEIIELFKKYHLRPHDLHNRGLSIDTNKMWPLNVVWKF